MNFNNKKIIITGASSGIGESIARLLVKQGAKIALFARRLERLEKIKNDLITINPNVLAIQCDVRDKEQILTGVKKVSEEYDGIDIVINNAGLGYFGPIEKMNPDQVNDVFQTNIMGPIHLIQATLPFLKKSGGKIVNISSSLSKRALPFLSIYAGSKSMLDAISDAIRLELKPYDIKVINYCPPETETEFHANSVKNSGLEMPTQHRKFKKADDVALDIIKAIEFNKREVLKSKFLKIMNFFTPRFLDRMFYKYMVLKILNLNNQ